MYIWVGADVDGQLSKIKEITRKTEDEIGFAHSNFTLPLHISLKMSFCVDDDISGAAIDSIAELYDSFGRFEVTVKGIEHFGNIVWIRMCESEELNLIHDRLNGMLSEKYGVGLHPYDCDYMFHTTLFMDDDGQKVGAAYFRVKDAPLPEKLTIDKLVIGTSQSGDLGTYKVIRSCELG